jgi:hypothetical protein
LSENPNKGNNLENIVIDERIILIWSLEKYLNFLGWIYLLQDRHK